MVEECLERAFGLFDLVRGGTSQLLSSERNNQLFRWRVKDDSVLAAELFNIALTVGGYRVYSVGFNTSDISLQLQPPHSWLFIYALAPAEGFGWILCL